MSDENKYRYADFLRDEERFFREFERRVALPCARAMFEALDKAWVASADHDAAPAPATKPMPADANGSGSVTQRPVAWARFFPNGGTQSVYLDRPPADSEPLYRLPTLTDEEREAIRVAILEMGTLHSGEFAKAATLRNLLERLK